MNVRVKREGVEDVFANDRVSQIMQQALVQRCFSPSSAADSHDGKTPSDAKQRGENRGLDWATASSNTVTESHLGEQRLCIPIHYKLRPHSRTEHYLRSPHAISLCCPRSGSSSASSPACSPSSSPATAGAASEQRNAWWCEEDACVAYAVVAECLRHHSFIALTHTDLRGVCRLPDTSADNRSVTTCEAPLASWQEFFELPPRWVMQSLGAVDRHVFPCAAYWQVRRGVTPLDVGATVVKTSDGALSLPSATGVAPTATTAEEEGVPASLSPSPTAIASAAAHYRVVATAAMSRGAYWVDITPAVTTATASPDTVERLDRATLWLDPPAPLHVDPLLPCDELYTDRAMSTSIYVFFLRALQQQEQRRKKHFCGGSGAGKDGLTSSRFFNGGDGDGSSSGDAKDPALLATNLSTRLAGCARRRREALADSLQRLTSWLTNSATESSGHREMDAQMPASRATVALQVRVDMARDCLQLRVRIAESTPAPDPSSSPTKDRDLKTSLPRKRWREAGEVGGSIHENLAPTGLDGRSPTVEVLLRSARKLAALYDLTRAALYAQHQQQQLSECTHEPTSTSVASDLLTKLIGSTTAETSTTSGSSSAAIAVEADADACAWRSVALWTSGALPREAHDTCPDAALDPAERAFLARFFTVLLRYRTLFGEQGYNQGPQAAVPPPIMAALARTFRIRAEAFASPLNVQLPQFGSLFPDTDAYFGSMGSFFDLMLGSHASSCSADDLHQRSSGDEASFHRFGDECHMEVNPPFDTALLRHMEEHLLLCLQQAETSRQSLLFLVVLPSHDLCNHEAAENTQAKATAKARLGRAAAEQELRSAGSSSCGATAAVSSRSTDRALRESPYCLSHVLCNAAESAYVDGHQHLLASPLFCIGTPTRLILLGNNAARKRFPAAAAQLEGVRVSWKELTENARKRN